MAVDASQDHPRTKLVPLLTQPVRFSIVAALAHVDGETFRALRDEIGLTDSALSKQIATLEEAGLVAVTKYFIGKRPATSVALTTDGRAAWDQHIEALRAIAAGETG